MHACRASCSLRSCLRSWYATPLGSALAAAERAQLEPLLPRMFGFHLLQVGALPPDAGLLESSPIRHRVVLDSDRLAGGCGLAAQPTALPIAADSVDAVVLYHALEFEHDPHQVLREAERVLIAEGSLIVIGFNPYSLWGLRGWLRRRRGDAPWCGRFVGLPRLRDWLALLGFDVELSRTLFFRPPLQRPGMLARLERLERAGARWWPPFGGCYLVAARKRVSTLTPIKPRWRPRRGLLPAGLAGPTTRRTGTLG
ncbi:MAG TPA: methyltransferase domain-containing protein [Gammaproteobacteria bacterium]